MRLGYHGYNSCPFYMIFSIKRDPLPQARDYFMHERLPCDVIGVKHGYVYAKGEVSSLEFKSPDTVSRFVFDCC